MTAHHARDAAYDVVLIAHVLSALAGFGVVAVAGAYALVLRRSGSPSEATRRYYRPGTNWAGRVLFAVPVLGVALVAMSAGDWSYSEGWVLGGILLWAAAAVVAELVLWPGERALQAAVSAAPRIALPEPGVAPDPGIAPPEPGVAPDPGTALAEPDMAPEHRRRCVLVATSAGIVAALLVVAAVAMVAKP